MSNFKKLCILLVIAYCLYLFVLTLTRFYNFQSEAIDVSYYRVTVDELSRFQIPRIWDDKQVFVWGDHFEPILFFLVPLYWIFKSPHVLIVFQVALVLLAAIPLFLVAKEKLKNFYLSISLVVAYLLFGGLEFGYMYGLHPILFAPFFLFWLHYFYVKKNWKLYFVFLFLSLFVKEEISLTLIFFGIYILLFKKNIRVGLPTIIISFLWAFLCFKIIFPTFNLGVGFRHLGQYGGSVINFVKNPGLFFSTLASPDYKLNTFIVSYGAFAFLPLVYPPAFLITIPAILEKLLSNNIAGMNGFHYSAVIISVVAIASVESLGIYLKIKNPKFKIFANPIFWTIIIFIFALYFHFADGYKPFYEESLHVDLIYKTLSEIPASSSISAQYQIAARITRPYGEIFPAPYYPVTADYIVVDLKMPLVLTTSDAMNKFLNSVNQNKNYVLIVKNDGILVWRKSPK